MYKNYDVKLYNFVASVIKRRCNNTLHVYS
jgi:hypothetical protein